ncbi:DegT/DnrJ/EryC1/StrS family aminotransferase [Yinghuangia sp. ASG 101]|uniref:DegT/DnrJ/EryC1/StrS family aminotransferase n=1 Tax=Yinghuangia sp. ASG 101 TaxID=2896848 RepID=UPI001E287E8F|nr:DegT/DnrJ/EryC1/StrS family aminotransferase [Yinghuangia sp. ASG 101]UGQ12390.1 DegT/DnrJ/EryC1/StrS family aminotransferase [Yinghuangia sp. ASG 101]
MTAPSPAPTTTPSETFSFPTRGTLLGDAEAAAVAEIIGSPDRLTQGVWRDRFEQQFREYAGARHAISVTSGTVALETAIRLLDLRPGDQVVVTPQTFQATIQPLLDSPAEVVFCDVEPGTLNLDPAALDAVVTDRTAAVILVHYGGLPARMTEITAIARRHGAVVIEDCAHALGARHRGRRPGALADIGCFSFHGTKALTTLGEGGMITLDRDDWAERLDRVRSNDADYRSLPYAGPDPEPALLPWMRYSDDIYRRTCTRWHRAGTNATLSEAAAAVGVVQLGRLPELTARRRAVATRLDAATASFPLVRTHRPHPGDEHAHHLYTCFVDAPVIRERLVRTLHTHGVEVQLRYFPLHLTPEWRARGHHRGECPAAERSWFDHQVNLPCPPSLTDRQADRLASVLHDCLTLAHRI